MGCSANRLERSHYDFEWKQKTFADNSDKSFRDKFRLRNIMRKRSLLLHIMLKQGTSWYALDS